jgi:hypothetical protein
MHNSAVVAVAYAFVLSVSEESLQHYNSDCCRAIVLWSLLTISDACSLSLISSVTVCEVAIAALQCSLALYSRNSVHCYAILSTAYCTAWTFCNDIKERDC